MGRHERRSAKAAERQSPDSFKIYMNAERYRIADHTLRSVGNQLQLMASISGPVLVLAAFASELYLKCLIVVEGKRFSEIHNLQKLFSLLDPATQLSVNNRWDAWTALPQQTRVYEMMEHHFGASSIRRDLAWTLRKGGEGFQSLRYIHESDGANSAFFLGDFHNLLREEVLSRRPEWRNHVNGPGKPLAGNMFDPPGTPFDSTP